MKKRRFKFDHFVLGYLCLSVVCILPAVSPVYYFLNNQRGMMPYLLIAVAITGIIYEYPPDKEADEYLKKESYAVFVSSFLFLIYDACIALARVDTDTYTYNGWDYCIMGCFLVPAIITINEIRRSRHEYFAPNANINNTNKNRIAIGNVTNV